MHDDDPGKPRLRQLLDESEMLLFLCNMWDSEDYATSKDGYTTFLTKYLPIAREDGFRWMPDGRAVSRSALDRALKLGTAGDRSLADIFDVRNRHTRRPNLLSDLKTAMVEYYWSEEDVSQTAAIKKFERDLRGANEERASLGKIRFAKPNNSTLRRWITQSETYERYSEKYGKSRGDRKYRGNGEGLVATFPLEYVLIDHTECDTYVIVVDEHGEVLGSFRPYLAIAIDLFSRMILAIHLTFDPPSVATLTATMIKAILPNDDWVERFGFRKGATDGHGQMTFVVFDNALENIGRSMRTFLANFGVRPKKAPIHCPEAKSQVERVLGTVTRSVIVRMPGRVEKPNKRPGKKQDAKERAQGTLDEVIDLMVEWVVTIYHLRPHTTTGVAPAWKFQDGLKAHGRDVPGDIAILDDVLGTAGSGTLTSAGIEYGGFVWHDQEITTQLLHDLAPLAPKRDQRHEGEQSANVKDVPFVAHPLNCSHLSIFNHRSGAFVRLPNRDKWAHGMSWKAATEFKKHRKQTALAFETKEEQEEALASWEKKLDDMLSHGKHREARLANRIRHHSPAQYRSGDIVEEVHAERTPNGMAAPEIKRTTPLQEAGGPRAISKGARRGGVKATIKGQETRKRNANAKEAAAARETAKVAVSERGDDSNFAPQKKFRVVENSSERMRRLRNEDKG